MRENSSKRQIPIYHVDAFTDEPFRGNPAAVCLLEQQYEDTILQSVAAEMNLSETAFLYPLEQKPLKESSIFSLRWFTPKVEVPLCGHATLATAAVLFYDIGISTNEITFETKSGKLIAKRDKNGILLNFPIDVLIPINPSQALLKAIGIAEFRDISSATENRVGRNFTSKSMLQSISYAKRTKQLLIHLSSEEAVKNLRPNFELMCSTDTNENICGVIVTSRGHHPYDFVSRYFAPWVGVNEDPVTGSAHTILALYWSKILGKREMLAYQLSRRGGKLIVRLSSNDRVDLIGNAVIVSKGRLYL